MIRLNAIFELKENAKPEEAIALGNELVEKSRQDKGNISYELLQSTTNPRYMMFCETWENDDVLTVHSNAPHFTRIVPQIEALSISGLSLQRFDF